MTIYAVHAPSVFEVFLSYEEADAFRNLLREKGYIEAETSLLSRRIPVLNGSSASADPDDY